MARRELLRTWGRWVLITLALAMGGLGLSQQRRLVWVTHGLAVDVHVLQLHTMLQQHGLALRQLVERQPTPEGK